LPVFAPVEVRVIVWRGAVTAEISHSPERLGADLALDG
jgi:hypothetical protein